MPVSMRWQGGEITPLSVIENASALAWNIFYWVMGLEDAHCGNWQP